MSETTWNQRTFDYIRQNSTILKSVADQMGIAPERLVGPMAKENNPYQLKTAIEVTKDFVALHSTDGGLVGHNFWSVRYHGEERGQVFTLDKPSTVA